MTAYRNSSHTFYFSDSLLQAGFDVTAYLSCVCRDPSFRNSCSGVELITGWVFWEEQTSIHPPHITDYRALSKWQSAFVQPFEILVTFLSDAQPNNKGAFMLWSRLGKGIDKTYFGGKRPQFEPSGSCCRWSKESCFKIPGLVCLCMGMQRFVL